MSVKVSKATAGSSKTTSSIDLFDGRNLTNEEKGLIRDRVGDFLVDTILKTVGGAKSPVSGEGWPRLSKEYRKFKEKNNRPGVANMEFTGNMLDALKFESTKDGIEVGVFGRNEAPKADGHNNFSGESSLPKRRFLPGEGQRFKREAMSRITDIINDVAKENVEIPDEKLSGVKSKTKLFSVLKELFPGSSNDQIIQAVLLSTPLRQKLADLQLLRFLVG